MKKNGLEYKTPKINVVDVCIKSLICTSPVPGGNESIDPNAGENL